jgi:hypothetical protein
MELEEFYENENERKNEKFIEGLKQNKKIKDVEKEYKRKSKEIRKEYKKGFGKKLEEEKKKEFKKISDKTKPKKKINTKEYKVKELNMDLGWKEKTYIKGVSKAYKIKRKVIDLYQENYPEKAIYLKYKTQKNTKKKYEEFGKFLNGNMKKLSENIKGFIKFLNKFSKESSQAVKQIIKRTIAKILGKKIKKQGDKNAEQKKGDKKESSEKDSKKE